MENQKRRRGDRHDGRRLRNLDAIHMSMPYIMPRRCDAEVYIAESVDVTDVLAYLKDKNEAEPEHKMTLFHIILAAIAKTIIHRPFLNRFIAGRRYYQRDIVSFSFAAKKQFSDKGEESMMIIKADGDTTLDQISRKVVGEVKEVRESGGNDLDEQIKFLTKLPRPVLRMIVTILYILEYYDKIPRFFSEGLPYYSTVLIANLGSIKCGAPYHHLTNFGTNSVMITVGEIHKEYIIDKDGTPVIRDMVDLGITLDERIADGFYFAKSVKLLKFLIANPKLLELPFREEVNYDD